MAIEIPKSFIDGLADTVVDPNPDILKTAQVTYQLSTLIFYHGLFENKIFSRGELEKSYIEDMGINRSNEVKRLVASFVNSMAMQGFVLGKDRRRIPAGRWVKRSTKISIDQSPETLANFFEWAVQLGKQAQVDDTSIGYLGYTAAFYRKKAL